MVNPFARLALPARRIVLATVVLIALLVGTAAFSAWRFERALASKDKARAARIENEDALQANIAFWHQREAMNEYLIAASPAYLPEIEAQGALFDASLQRISTRDASAQRFVRRARRNNAAYLAAFLKVHGRANQGARAETTVTNVLNRLEPTITTPLADLSELYRSRIPGLLKVGAASERDAIISTVVATLLALLAAIAFAWHALGLVRRLDLVIARVRSTASILSKVASELRAAAQESASATTEQSSAVSETSTTVEQLALTATSIADNTRAIGAAAGQTGDTMHDMQEKVEAIASRSLALGERSQKIGEILSLIDSIAERTNLLALNAAIEAARAGEAGRGFAVVASEVRKLADRSIASSDAIKEIIAGIQDETNATIMATEQGTKQAREVADLMTTTAEMVEESILATRQQKSAADQVAAAIVQIRESTQQLAAETHQRAATAEEVEMLIGELEATVAEEGRAEALA